MKINKKTPICELWNGYVNGGENGENVKWWVKSRSERESCVCETLKTFLQRYNSKEEEEVEEEEEEEEL